MIRPRPTQRKRLDPNGQTRPTRSPLGRVAGNGSRESEREAHLLNLWLASLDEALATLIRQALTWGREHRETLPRSLAEAYEKTAQEAYAAAMTHENLAEQLQLARRQRRRSARQLEAPREPRGPLERIAATLGWRPPGVREKCLVHEQEQSLVALARRAEKRADAARMRLSSEEEQRRQLLLEAFEDAAARERLAFPGPDTAPQLEVRLGTRGCSHPRPRAAPRR